MPPKLLNGIRLSGPGRGLRRQAGGTTTGIPAFTPGSISGLVGMFDYESISPQGDNTALAAWPDTSGSGATATQGIGVNQPKYRTGANAGVQITNATGFVVAGMTLTPNNFTVAVVHTPTNPNIQGLFATGSNLAALALRLNLNLDFYSNGGYMINSGVRFESNVKQVFGLRVSATGQGGGEVFSAGRSLYATPGPQNIALPSTAQTTQYLGWLQSGALSAEGYMRRAYIYNRALSDSEWRQLLGYAANKDGIIQPDTNRLLFFDGNSLTFGAGGDNTSWVQYTLAALSGGFRAYNYGLPSQMTSTMLTNSPAKYNAAYDANIPKKICTFWEMTNDLKSNTNPTTTYNNAKSYCAAVRAAGYKVIIGTITPRNDSVYGGFEADRQTVNANVRANWTTFADGLADIGADSTLGPAGAYSNLTYYSADAVHFRAPGYQIIADSYFTPAINALS